MAEVRVELALSLAIVPTEGLVITLAERQKDSYRILRRWAWAHRSISPGELEDVMNELSLAVVDHLIVGPGVQLALHD